MKTSVVTSVSIVGIFFLVTTAVPSAVGESNAGEGAKILLDEAQRSQAERRLAAMQKERSRLDEDAKQVKEESNDLEQRMSKVDNATAGVKSRIEQIAGRKTRVLQDLELLPLRMEAEKLKQEGLSLLANANLKAREALAKQNDELDARKALMDAEIQQLSESTSSSEFQKPKLESFADLRRSLEKARDRKLSAEARAREAMDLAARKLLQADDATAKAEKKQGEIDAINSGNVPVPAEPGKIRQGRVRR